MELEKLKQKSNFKGLLRGKSAYGKTFTASKVALRVAGDGGSVLYNDTEAEGATTMVSLVESGEFDEEVVKNIEYNQVESFDDLMKSVGHDTQKKYDLVVVDTLDHKHTLALKDATDMMHDHGGEEAFKVYPEMYSNEKEMMETLGKPKTNILATLDPESGDMDKAKGVQANVHGYFSIVVDLMKDGNEFNHIVRNWVTNATVIGKSVSADLDEVLADKILERVEK